LYGDAENFAKAAEWYRKAVNDPATKNKPQYLYRLSQVEELGGNTEAALAALKQALDQLPEVPLLHFQQGWIYYHAKRYDEAIQKFDEVVTKYSQDKDIVRRCLFLLSTLYVQKGDLRKGEEVLEKILAEEPDDPSVNNDLGYLYADHGKNLEQAKSMIQKAVKAEPENPAYLDSMGWVLYKLGEYKEAVPYLEKAVKLPRGGDSTIWDHLGDCYARLKQMDKAKDAWQKALDDAKADAKPDEKLIKRIEQKLAGADATEGPDLP
jgi:Tfp pilus assembly protein PilF